VRRLRRKPGFTVTAAASLALGIGGTTALFSVIDGVVLGPLPYEEADRLVMVGHESPTDRLGMPDGGYLEYVERSRTLSEVALYIETSSPVAGTGAPLEPGIIMASTTLLPLLRVSPILGRGFTEEDTDPDADPVAIVTHGFWTRQLGADPEVLGKPVVPGSSRLVVGMLPRGFEFLRPEATVVFGNRFDAPDYFIPIERLDPSSARFGNFMYQSLARLAPVATAADAQRELESLMRDAAVDYPGGFTVAALDEGGYHAVVERLSDAVVGDVVRVLWILMGAVGFVLLIATANVANLFLVRAESRSRELAVRRALGASGAAIAGAFLWESILLAGLGGVSGLALARMGTGPIPAGPWSGWTAISSRPAGSPARARSRQPSMRWSMQATSGPWRSTARQPTSRRSSTARTRAAASSSSGPAAVAADHLPPRRPSARQGRRQSRVRRIGRPARSPVASPSRSANRPLTST
jgi:hypothetical protein